MKILNRSPFLIASGTEDLKEISNHLLQRANKIFKLRDGVRMGFSKTNEKFYSSLFFADFDHNSIYISQLILVFAKSLKARGTGI